MEVMVSPPVIVPWLLPPAVKQRTTTPMAKTAIVTMEPITIFFSILIGTYVFALVLLAQFPFD